MTSPATLLTPGFQAQLAAVDSAAGEPAESSQAEGASVFPDFLFFAVEAMADPAAAQPGVFDFALPQTHSAESSSVEPQAEEADEPEAALPGEVAENSADALASLGEAVIIWPQAQTAGSPTPLGAGNVVEPEPDLALQAGDPRPIDVASEPAGPDTHCPPAGNPPVDVLSSSANPAMQPGRSPQVENRPELPSPDRAQPDSQYAAVAPPAVSTIAEAVDEARGLKYSSAKGDEPAVTGDGNAQPVAPEAGESVKRQNLPAGKGRSAETISKPSRNAIGARSGDELFEPEPNSQGAPLEFSLPRMVSPNNRQGWDEREVKRTAQEDGLAQLSQRPAAGSAPAEPALPQFDVPPAAPIAAQSATAPTTPQSATQPSAPTTATAPVPTDIASDIAQSAMPGPTSSAPQSAMPSSAPGALNTASAPVPTDPAADTAWPLKYALPGFPLPSRAAGVKSARNSEAEVAFEGRVMPDPPSSSSQAAVPARVTPETRVVENQPTLEAAALPADTAKPEPVEPEGIPNRDLRRDEDETRAPVAHGSASPAGNQSAEFAGKERPAAPAAPAPAAYQAAPDNRAQASVPVDVAEQRVAVHLPPPARSAGEPVRAEQPVEPAPEPALPRSPVRDITLKLDGEKRVEVRLTERRGEVHFTVRTPDPQLAGDLRRELPELTTRFHEAGLRGEAWHPASAAGERRGEPSAGLSTQTPQQQAGDGEQRRRQDQPEEQPRGGADRPDEQKGKEFSWFLESMA